MDSLLKSSFLSHSPKMLEIFNKVFNLTEFRPNQLEAINAALLNYDVFCIMPTGGGKSLCYQLPAMTSRGVTVVFSPLCSLILDQVTSMNKRSKGCAASLTSDISVQTSNNIFADLSTNEPTIKILFITPEKLAASSSLNTLLQSLCNRNLLARFVIDEAHCMIQLGNSFRPAYKELSKLRLQFPNVPLIALTASVTKQARIEIEAQLKLKETKWFVQSFNRPNLKLEVRIKSEQSYSDILPILSQQFPNQTGIIYCLSKNDCDTLSGKLRADGIKAVAYHAGLTTAIRKTVQNDWISGKYTVIVATTAFGMGIDKADVRFVIHDTMPSSIEGYYQQIGRAGRDSLPSSCIMFFSPQDFTRWKTLLTTSSTNEIVLKTSMNCLCDVLSFCVNKSECRRTQVLKYFGEHFDRRNCLMNQDSICDNCRLKDSFKEENLTEVVKAILSSIRQIVGPFSSTRKENISPGKLVNILCGSENTSSIEHHRKADFYAVCRHLSQSDVQRLVLELMAKKFLSEFKTQSLCIGEKADDFCFGNKSFLFSVSVDVQLNENFTGSKRQFEAEENDRKKLKFDKECSVESTTIDEKDLLIAQLRKQVEKKNAIIAEKDVLLKQFQSKKEAVQHCQLQVNVTNKEASKTPKSALEQTPTASNDQHNEELWETFKEKRLSHRNDALFSCGNCKAKFYFYLAAQHHLSTTLCGNRNIDIIIDTAKLQKESHQLEIEEWTGLNNESAASPLMEPQEPNIPSFTNIQKRAIFFVVPMKTAASRA